MPLRRWLLVESENKADRWPERDAERTPHPKLRIRPSAVPARNGTFCCFHPRLDGRTAQDRQISGAELRASADAQD